MLAFYNFLLVGASFPNVTDAGFNGNERASKEKESHVVIFEVFGMLVLCLAVILILIMFSYFYFQHLQRRARKKME